MLGSIDIPALGAYVECMPRKTKTFDCVEMKNRIQAERLAEYEATKDEFASYIDFINARVKDSDLAQFVGQKVPGRGTKPEG